MPGIVVFRRRWMVASDDFVIPFSTAFVVRGLWMIILAVSLGVHHGMHHNHWSNATEEHLCQQTIDYYIGGYLALLFATNIMEISIAWMSGKGSIMDTEPRSLIPSLLYVRLMLSIIELAWLSVGIKWVWLDTVSCKMTVEIYIAKAVVVFSWMFLFIVAVIVLCTFDTAGQTWFEMQQAQNAGYCMDSADGPQNYKLHITQKYQRRWQGCFRYAFCCRGEGQGDENVYVFIGRTLSEYFQDLDVVPSDFASGLVLLRRYQKYQETLELERALEERRINEMTTDGVPLKKSSLRYQRTSNAQTLRLDCKEELLQYKDIAYYMNYALAAYGWPIYMKNNVTCGCCKLTRSFRCCYCCRSMDKRLHKSVLVEEDNCCRCHFSALKRIASLHNSDVVYCSYHNSMYKSPFYVALDHMKKAVVVVIRGTLSLQDILTDFTVEPERIPVDGGDPSWFGHKGMVRCAVYIEKKLINEGVLQKAFNSDPDCGTQNYRLILLGHSLGAGTAAILAFLLRPRYPDLFCYAYSPPGANLSLSAAKYARDFVISVVIGKDMIPRLSLFTLEDLRNNIMTLITKSRMSKWRILRGCACRCAFVCCYGCKCVKFDGQQDELDAEIQSIEIPEITHANSMRFYPPGRILHVVKTCSVNRGWGRTETMYEPVWAGLDEFQSIKISGLMWKDHMPDFVLEALNKCLPSKEQEQAVMNAPDPPRPVALEVPNSIRYSRSRDSYSQDSISYGSSDVDQYSVEIPSVRIEQTAAVASKNLNQNDSRDSITIEIHKGKKNHISTANAHRSQDCSPQVPLARPESSFDDSDLEESATSSRVSSTWKDFHLPVVEQSIDSLNSSRSRCEAPISPIAIKSLSTTPTIHEHLNDQFFSIPSIPTSSGHKSSAFSVPPPKPPRTFETERSKEWNCSESNTSGISSNSLPSPGLAPPKPPRTFEYVMIDCASYSYDVLPHNSLSTNVSPYKESLSYPNGFPKTEGSSLIKCQDFVDNSNPLSVSATGTSDKSYSSTVTYLQDRSCLTLCNGLREINSSQNYKTTRSFTKTYDSNTTNTCPRVLSDDKLSLKVNISDNQLKLDQKSFSLANTADINCRLKNGLSGSTGKQNVVIRQGKGNKNRSKRRAIYWDGDETTNLLQYSCSCSDIPDVSVLEPNTLELDNDLVENEVLKPEQGGFRKGHGTVESIFILKNTIDKYVKSKTNKRNNLLFTCFIDFKKAFDNISRNKLFVKLKEAGINGKFFSILLSMYTNDKSEVKIEHLLSPSFGCHVGVKQGCMLSPTLFNLYLHDLPKELNLCNTNDIQIGETPLSCLLYADDLVIVSKSAKGLQDYLNKLQSFCNNSALSVNNAKSKVLIFNNTGKSMNNYTFYIDNFILENVRSYKYLGIYMNANGNFNLAKEEIKKVALKALFKLRKDMGNYFRKDLKLTMKLFDCLVAPILLYGSEVWGIDDKGTLNKDPIEAVHVKFCKMLLGVNKKASNDACRSELGRFPLRTSAKIRSLGFWLKISQSEESKLAYKSFVEIKNNDNTAYWSKKIKNCLYCLGLGDLWEKQSDADRHPKVIKSLLKQRIRDIEFQTWLGNVHNDTRKNPQHKNKLRTYRMFKTNYSYENYLSQVTNIDHRISLTKLRISNHQLEIEKGRYARPYKKAEDRICPICKIETEDEAHFLLKCTLYDEKRSELFIELEKEIHVAVNKMQHDDLFLFLINPPDIMNTQNIIAKFIYNITNLRKETLE